MIPARQGFDSHDPAGGDFDLWLVVEIDLRRADGVAQIVSLWPEHPLHLLAVVPTGVAATTAVGTDVESDEPSTFVAVTVTRSVAPASMCLST